METNNWIRLLIFDDKSKFLFFQPVPKQLISLLYNFAYIFCHRYLIIYSNSVIILSENFYMSQMNPKKFPIQYCILSSTNIHCRSLPLNLDNPIWYGTLCTVYNIHPWMDVVNNTKEVNKEEIISWKKIRLEINQM